MRRLSSVMRLFGWLVVCVCVCPCLCVCLLACLVCLFVCFSFFFVCSFAFARLFGVFGYSQRGVANKAFAGTPKVGGMTHILDFRLSEAA